jgi:hypothetical protein
MPIQGWVYMFYENACTESFSHTVVVILLRKHHHFLNGEYTYEILFGPPPLESSNY